MTRTGFVAPLSLGLIACFPLITFGQPTSAPATAPTMDPRADALLKKMSDFVTLPKNLAFTVEMTVQITTPGKTVDINQVWDISIQRPNRLAIVLTSKEAKSFSTYLDGKEITLYSPAENKYLTDKAEDTIDGTIRKFRPILGQYPFIDVVKNNVYQGLIEGLTSGELGDKIKIGEAETQELRFGQKLANWNIWIEIGDKPWPRKMSAEITSPDGQGKMILTLLFTKWAVPTELPESIFVFKAPAGATKAEPKKPE